MMLPYAHTRALLPSWISEESSALGFDIGIGRVVTVGVFAAEPVSWVLSCVFTCSIPFHPPVILKIRVSSQQSSNLNEVGPKPRVLLTTHTS